MIHIMLLYAISASTTIMGKSLLAYASPLCLTGLRTIGAGIFFLSCFAATKSFRGIQKYFLPCLPIILCSFYLSNTLKFWSLYFLKSSQASALSSLEPLFALCFSYIIFSQRVTKSQILGLFICLSGSFLTLDFSVLPEIKLLAAFVFLASIAASAYGALHMRFLIGTLHYPPVVVNGISMLCAGVLALSTSLIIEQPLTVISYNSFIPFAGLLLGMIGISNIFAYHLYSILLVRYSVLLISCASFLRPFFTACLETSLCGKPFPSEIIVPMIVISLGLGILFKEECSPEYRVQN